MSYSYCSSPSPSSGSNDQESVIILMGPTGSGKTTFANLVSGSNLAVGTGLKSCTDKLQTAGPLNIDGQRIVLVDTPGFDDTTQSDVTILSMIALFLQKLPETDGKLVGILYFHPISDRKMGGAARKNFNMFRKICGDKALPNVLLVTNMWGSVSPYEGQQREDELKQSNLFFKPALQKGAKITRHHGNGGSAERIIRSLLNNHPLSLLIQEELQQRKELRHTSAAMELSRELHDQVEEHEAKTRGLTEQKEQAKNRGDERVKKELKARIDQLKEKTKKLKGEAKRLVSGLQGLDSLCKREFDRLKEGLLSKAGGLSETEALILAGVVSAVVLAVVVTLAITAPVSLGPTIAIATFFCTGAGVFMKGMAKRGLDVHKINRLPKRL